MRLAVRRQSGWGNGVLAILHSNHDCDVCFERVHSFWYIINLSISGPLTINKSRNGHSLGSTTSTCNEHDARLSITYCSREGFKLLDRNRFTAMSTSHTSRKQRSRFTRDIVQSGATPLTMSCDSVTAERRTTRRLENTSCQRT